jgi:hypothetical protein
MVDFNKREIVFLVSNDRIIVDFPQPSTTHVEVSDREDMPPGLLS